MRTSQRWREDASCFWPSLVVTTKTSSSMSSDRDSMVRTEPSAPSKTWSPGTRSPRSAQPSGNRSEIGTGMRAVSGWALPDPEEPRMSRWGLSSMSKNTCSPSALTPKAMFVLGRSSHGTPAIFGSGSSFAMNIFTPVEPIGTTSTNSARKFARSCSRADFTRWKSSPGGKEKSSTEMSGFVFSGSIFTSWGVRPERFFTEESSHACSKSRLAISFSPPRRNFAEDDGSPM